MYEQMDRNRKTETMSTDEFFSILFEKTEGATPFSLGSEMT